MSTGIVHLIISYFLGLLKDKLGNYTVAFICAGIPPLVGAILMCFIYRVKDQKPMVVTIEENNNDMQQNNPKF